MTEPDLTPAQSEAVRRLLAQARHDEPMPPEVVDRLDGVLDELGAERRDAPGPHDATTGGAAGSAAGSGDTDDPGGSVVPMRKRSRIPQVLLAAAAVAVVGVGVTQVLPSGDDAGSGDAGSQADSSMADAAPDEGGSHLRSEAPGAPRESTAQDQARAESYLAPGRARRLVEQIQLDGLRFAGPADARARDLRRHCGPDELGPGQLRAPATLDDDPALVVFHQPEDGQRRADIYVCDPARDLSRDQEPLTVYTMGGR